MTRPAVASCIIRAMDRSLHFRKAFAAQVASALGISFALVGNVSGCGGAVVIDGGAGAGGTGGDGAGGTGGGGGFGGASSSSSSTSTSTSSGTTSSSSSSSGNALCSMPTGNVTKYLACITPDSTGSCPAKENAAGSISASFDVCTCLISVESGPDPDPSGGGLCCYGTAVEFVCVVGRPLPSEHGPLAAPIDNAKRGWSEEHLRPCVDDLSPAERDIIAQRWIRDGLFEHAAIASFSRLALALMAASADADLVQAAHEAAIDEVRHAKLALSLAAGYRGEPVAPGPLPLPEALPFGIDLTELALSSVIEGAVGETLAAVVAAEQAAVATDPAVRRVLRVIADDEARHAELAFRVIAFAIAAGGKPVRDVVAQAFVQASTRLPKPPEDVPLPAHVAEAHGFVTSSAAHAAFVHAMDDIVLPIGRALCQTAPGSA